MGPQGPALTHTEMKLHSQDLWGLPEHAVFHPTLVSQTSKKVLKMLPKPAGDQLGRDVAAGLAPVCLGQVVACGTGK